MAPGARRYGGEGGVGSWTAFIGPASVLQDLARAVRSESVVAEHEQREPAASSTGDDPQDEVCVRKDLRAVVIGGSISRISMRRNHSQFPLFKLRWDASVVAMTAEGRQISLCVIGLHE